MKRTLLLTSLLLCGAAALLHAQNGTIRGNVYDKTTGEPILYGSVRLVGTPIGDITDLNGFFSLSVRPGDYNLVVSYLG